MAASAAAAALHGEFRYLDDNYCYGAASPLDSDAGSGFAFAGYPPATFGFSASNAIHDGPYVQYGSPLLFGSSAGSISSASPASESALPIEGDLFAGSMNLSNAWGNSYSFQLPPRQEPTVEFATPDALSLPTELEYRLYELSQANLAGSASPVSPAPSPEQGMSIAVPKPAAIVGNTSEEEEANADLAAGDTYWAAVVSRDPRAVNKFWYGVTSTKIYCRPTCPSRRPMRVNIKYFTTCQQAEKAGYRPCKRCTPDEAFETSVVRQATCTFRAAALIESRIKSGKKSPTLTQLAEAVGMSPFYLQRTFKKHYGLSPKAYANRLARDSTSTVTSPLSFLPK